MLVDGLHAEETRVVIADDDNLIDFDIESSSKKQTKGNLYLAKVTRVEPSLQAAFVEYGSERQGFLPFSEIHPDYYQIPIADKQQLLQEQEAEDKALAEKEDKEILEGDGDESEAGQDAESAAEAEASGEVEDLGSDEPYEEAPRRAKVKRYKIQEVIKKNQIILIQVIKEERGNKGASVTSYISLPGRYCVLMPNSHRGGGVSRKIGDVKERKRLKTVVEGLDIAKGMSIIMRTAGLERTKAEITRDYSYLIKLWNKIRKDTLSSVAPSLVHEEASVVKRSLRDLYNNDFDEVIIAGEETFNLAKDFMKLIMPSHVKKITQYTDPTPLFNQYGVEGLLAGMFDTVVVMQSGGYIVINSTEALISIDVNSGRATGERNVEDTATSINIEAANEIARQLRLRDLAGLVVIDFIDMINHRHRRQVERALKDALKQDRAKIQVGRISAFGLLEMSRQRLRPSLTEINMVECPTCKTSGYIRSPDSAMVQLMRSIENEISLSDKKIVKVDVFTSKEMALHFLNSKRKHISALESQYGFELKVIAEEMPPSVFKLQLEDSFGGRSKIISSDDKEGARLPNSREGGNSRKRGRNNRKNFDKGSDKGFDKGFDKKRGNKRGNRPYNKDSNENNERDGE
ncbi:MAG: ribonuclease E/G, partial [Alphaproteobacteria bacterium CG11_big_fil_rev_8_21_14_0_20_44_7]